MASLILYLVVGTLILCCICCIACFVYRVTQRYQEGSIFDEDGNISNQSRISKTELRQLAQLPSHSNVQRLPYLGNQDDTEFNNVIMQSASSAAVARRAQDILISKNLNFLSQQQREDMDNMPVVPIILQTRSKRGSSKRSKASPMNRSPAPSTNVSRDVSRATSRAVSRDLPRRRQRQQAQMQETQDQGVFPPIISGAGQIRDFNSSSGRSDSSNDQQDNTGTNFNKVKEQNTGYGELFNPQDEDVGT